MCADHPPVQTHAHLMCSARLQVSNAVVPCTIRDAAVKHNSSSATALAHFYNSTCHWIATNCRHSSRCTKQHVVSYDLACVLVRAHTGGRFLRVCWLRSKVCTSPNMLPHTQCFRVSLSAHTRCCYGSPRGSAKHGVPHISSLSTSCGDLCRISPSQHCCISHTSGVQRLKSSRSTPHKHPLYPHMI
jgi:hypothetical protein